MSTRFTAWQSGAYVQATRDLGARVNVTIGGRVDDYQYLEQTRFSPRASASLRLTDGLEFRASYGHYFQQPFFVFLSAFPENRSLVPWRADHYVSGLSWQRADGWRATLEAYRKNYRDYPVARDYPTLSLANVGDTFNVREILFPLVSVGDGFAQGVEVFVEKKRTGRLYGQANLAVSKTRHAGLDGVLRPGSFDYPFVANAVGGYRLTPNWEMSMRLAWLAGRPYTPYNVATSTAQVRGVYDLAQVNALRAPDYFRVDVRVDRTFRVRGRAAGGLRRRAEPHQPQELRRCPVEPLPQRGPGRGPAGAVPAARAGVAVLSQGGRRRPSAGQPCLERHHAGTRGARRRRIIAVCAPSASRRWQCCSSRCRRHCGRRGSGGCRKAGGCRRSSSLPTCRIATSPSAS